MAKYMIQTNTVKVIGNVKVGMLVTFIDEVNGKPDLTHYHEIESVNPEVIGNELSLVALEYEAREGKTVKIPVLETGRRVRAEVKAISIVSDEVVVK